jgi:hypothetical protein
MGRGVKRFLTLQIRAIALALLVVIFVASSAQARVAPDSECDYFANYAQCSEFNRNAQGTTEIRITLSSFGNNTGLYGSGELDSNHTSGCINDCEYYISSLQIYLAPLWYSFPGASDQFGDYTLASGTLGCVGSHTVAVKIVWRIKDKRAGTWQSGTYETKKLTMHC